MQTPLQDIAASFNVMVEEIKEPHFDDPSLALLFSQLRMKTLQAAKGTSEISGRSEFKFILQIAKVFCRMGWCPSIPYSRPLYSQLHRLGCHVLALDLVRSWSFARPSTIIHSPPTSPLNGAMNFTAMQPLFPLEPAINRRSSIMIDMDLSSVSSTADGSGISTPVKLQQSPGLEKVKEESDLIARKAGLGKLIKSAKQDVQVPEFDMNAFF